MEPEAARRAAFRIAETVAAVRIARRLKAKSDIPTERTKFASVQVEFTGEQANMIREFPLGDWELHEEGREKNPHVTVKYGIHSDDPGALITLLGGLPPITATLGPLDVFESEEYDVLVISIDSPALHAMNGLITRSVQVTNTFPTYVPHATIAYLKKGEGAKYKGMRTYAGLRTTFDRVVFSPMLEGTDTEIVLTGKGQPRPSRLLAVANDNEPEPVLSDTEVMTYLESVPDWELIQEEGGTWITRTYPFPDRRAAANFLKALFSDCNERNHHADIVLDAHDVTISYTTHAVADRLTILDFESAAEADRLALEHAVPVPAPARQRAAGGPGSGNFGHAGRPGTVGGSAGDGPQAGGNADPVADAKRVGKSLEDSAAYDEKGDHYYFGAEGTAQRIADKLPGSKVVKSRTGWAVERSGRMLGPEGFGEVAAQTIRDVHSLYPNAPKKPEITDKDVERAKQDLSKRGRLNDDGTVSVFHATLSDPEDIYREGLIPAKEKAPGQDWEATHSKYATYFHLDRSVAERDTEYGGDVIEARLPVTKEMLRRILPDEDSSDDPNEGHKILTKGGGAIAVIGGVEKEHLVRSKKQRNAGGPGSGNFGHAGRPGERGGSAEGDGGEPRVFKPRRSNDGDPDGLEDSFSHTLREKFPELHERYKAYSGTEHGSVGAHTRRVEYGWKKQITKDELNDISKRYGKDVSHLMDHVVALHDIGKGEAVASGDKSKQHAITSAVMNDVLKKAGFEDRDILLARQLINHDQLGKIVEHDHPQEPTVKSMENKAKLLDMPVRDFAQLQLALFHADAGAYDFVRHQHMRRRKDGKLEFRYKTDRLAKIKALGGPGSGNFHHEGRPGQVGGSAPEHEGGGDKQHPDKGKGKHTKEAIHEAYAMKKAGMSAKAIHEKTGISVPTQYHAFKKIEAKAKENAEQLAKFTSDPGITVVEHEGKRVDVPVPDNSPEAVKEASDAKPAYVKGADKKADIAKAYEMKQAGASIKAITEATGLSGPTQYHALKKVAAQKEAMAAELAKVTTPAPEPIPVVTPTDEVPVPEVTAAPDVAGTAKPPSEQAAKHKSSKEDIAKAYEMKKAGATIKQIHEATGVTGPTQYHAFKKLSKLEESNKDKLAAKPPTPEQVKAVAEAVAKVPEPTATPKNALTGTAHDYGYQYLQKKDGLAAGKYAWFKNGIQTSAPHEKDEYEKAAATMHFGKGPQPDDETPTVTKTIEEHKHYPPPEPEPPSSIKEKLPKPGEPIIVKGDHVESAPKKASGLSPKQEAVQHGYEWKKKTDGPNAGKFAWFKNGTQYSAPHAEHEQDIAAKGMHYGVGPSGTATPTGKEDQPPEGWPISNSVERKMGKHYVTEIDNKHSSWLGKMLVNEKNSIVSYTGSGSGTVNGNLRAEPHKLSKNAQDIQKSLEKSPTPPPPTLVWRGVHEDFGKVLKTLNKGDTIRLDGFQSTSVNPTKAASWGTTLIEIVPKAGGYVKPISQHPGEMEYLLPHGRKYKVRGISTVKIENHSTPRQVLQLEMV